MTPPKAPDYSQPCKNSHCVNRGKVHGPEHTDRHGRNFDRPR
jgi:hypothetical protein